MANAFPTPPTELSSVLRNIGYPVAIVRHIHDVERLTTLQQVNQLHKDLIEPLFKGLRERDPPVIYTTLQVSIFKTLHSYLRRMALSRTPVNPAAITTALLEKKLSIQRNLSIKNRIRRSHSRRMDSRRIRVG